jgi:hypothetical protein
VECPAIFGGRGEPETQADGGVNVMCFLGYGNGVLVRYIYLGEDGRARK